MQGGQLRLQLRRLRPLVVVLQDLRGGGTTAQGCEEGQRYKGTQMESAHKGVKREAMQGRYEGKQHTGKSCT